MIERQADTAAGGGKWVPDGATLAELHQISERISSQAELPGLLQAVIEGATALARAPMGTLQLFVGRRETASVGAPIVSGSLCHLERIVVEDVAHSGLDDATRAMMAAHGVRSVQSTPMLARDGRLLGAIVTHWRERHRPDRGTLLLLDLLARLAADVVELRHREDTLIESEQRFRAMADDTPHVLWVTDARGDLQFANRAFAEYFGVAQGDYDSEGWHPHLHPDDKDAYLAAFVACMRARAPFSGRVRVRHKTGTYRWIESVAKPRFDSFGNFLGMAGSSSDVHDRIEAEEHRREAERRKDEFLAVLSHELRNPLAPIRNSLFILDRAAPGSDQSRRAREVIGRQVTHLTRLVDDLLDVTRISSGKAQLRPERLELAGLIKQAIEDHRAAFIAAGIELDHDLPAQPLWLIADPTRVAQIIGNLLGNACKFTHRGGHVRVALRHDEADAIVSVVDDGVGIDAVMLEQMFRPFTQLSQTLDRSYGGLGLGLALVKGLVELHGGRVRASSPGIGLGAEFHVHLPRSGEEGDEPTPAPEPRVEHQTVLIIEDNPDAADTLKGALEIMGYSVEVAYDGPSGLAMARKLHPQAVLCDIGLPGMSGYEVGRRLSADESLAGTLLIALTGYALPEDRAQTAASGFAHHVAKPPSLQVLHTLLSGGSDEEPPPAHEDEDLP
jgi:PAS domain S-box-containing protein